MKLLFLDIDGVLVLNEWGTPNWHYGCVAALRYFLEECEDVKIVLSSTWRLKPELIYEFMTLLQVQSIRNKVIGMTPDIELLKRDKEVVAYLNSIARARLLLDVYDYVKDWVVVDDAPEFFQSGAVSEKHIEFVDRTKGFTRELAEKLIKRFKETK